MLKLGCGEKLTFAVKVNKDFGVSVLNKHARIGCAAVQAAKPATVKGVFIKSMSVSSTMGIGVPVQVVSDAE